ncbi:MAG: MBL fold metallo-hydrolase [Bacteriovoracaceae bacterium]|nr:MBL fold metallo-hydrolase [Bacteriovoracaceae bacterium]
MSHTKNKITVLGSGTSTGIPLIGCQCKVCLSIDHRDKRLRSSLFLETRNHTKIIVDTTPDFRTQLLANNIHNLDAAIITHEHADHLHGIDDLRPFSFGPPPRDIPLFTQEKTRKIIEQRFSYIFQNGGAPNLGGGVPRLKMFDVPLNELTQILEVSDFTFFSYKHGHGETMGFHHEGFAYVVDCMELSEAQIATLKNFNLDLLIIDCLQRHSHSTHLTVERCFDYIEKINPKQAGLIHMGHDLSHRHLESLARERFGNRVFPLYDGQNLFY